MAADVSRSYTVVAVDEDRAALAKLARTLARLGYRQVTTSNPHEVLPLVERESADILVLAIDLLRDSVELSTLARQAFPQVVRIIVAAAATVEVTIRAINEGEVFRFLRKPWNRQELNDALTAAVRHREGLRAATDAELLASRRGQMLTGLETEHPGITQRPETGERIVLSPAATRETLRRVLSAGWLKRLS
jgi:two-component system probable response regulator PhcQ